MKFLALIAFLVIFNSCGNTIYIVRHAEKAPVPAGTSQAMASDPPLSEAGLARANDLREELKNDNIRQIFSTNFKRTISTALPLSELNNIHTMIYSSRKDSMDQFIQQLKRIKKGNILVVGHSNTIDDIANKLAGSVVVANDLAETQYDNLFILKRKGSKYKFDRKKYGVPTE
jgi:broad specificity phosphatase PhoE